MIENPIGMAGIGTTDTHEDEIILYLRGAQFAMSKEQAIDLAVRLVAIADDYSEPKFGKWLREFLNT